MNEIIEQSFIKNFIDKRYRDRLLFELSSDKKRRNAIDRFSHNAEELLNPQKILLKGDITISDIEAQLKQRKINASSYVLSFEFSDGHTCTPREALSYFEQSPTAVIVMFSDSIALIKAETEGASPSKYLLCNDK